MKLQFELVHVYMKIVQSSSVCLPFSLYVCISYVVLHAIQIISTFLWHHVSLITFVLIQLKRMAFVTKQRKFALAQATWLNPMAFT